MVEAMGMPRSMWVAWMSPFESESRMAAQLAPLVTVELMPYFLKRPFSWAMTIGRAVGQRDDAEAQVAHLRRVARPHPPARKQGRSECRDTLTEELAP